MEQAKLMQIAGALAAIGAVMLVVGYVTHTEGGDLAGSADVASQMRMSQYILGAGAMCLATGALAGLAARGPTSRTALGGSGMALVALTGVFMALAGLVVAAMADAAVAGDEAAFATLDHLADQLFFAAGFWYLGMFLVALAEARSAAPRTPRWAAWIGVAALGIGVVGQAAVMVSPGGDDGFWGLPAWAIPILGFLWLAWFGVGVVRAAGRASMPA